MTTKDQEKAEKRLNRKIANAAALKFQPWKIDLKKLPTNEEFGCQMVWVRVAAVTNNKTKAELINVVKELEQDGKEAVPKLFEQLVDAEEYFKEAAEMCSVAHNRLLVAACTLEAAK